MLKKRKRFEEDFPADLKKNDNSFVSISDDTSLPTPNPSRKTPLLHSGNGQSSQRHAADSHAIWDASAKSSKVSAHRPKKTLKSLKKRQTIDLEHKEAAPATEKRPGEERKYQVLEKEKKSNKISNYFPRKIDLETDSGEKTCESEKKTQKSKKHVKYLQTTFKKNKDRSLKVGLNMSSKKKEICTFRVEKDVLQKNYILKNKRKWKILKQRPVVNLSVVSSIEVSENDEEDDMETLVGDRSPKHAFRFEVENIHFYKNRHLDMHINPEMRILIEPSKCARHGRSGRRLEDLVSEEEAADDSGALRFCYFLRDERIRMSKYYHSLFKASLFENLWICHPFDFDLMHLIATIILNFMRLFPDKQVLYLSESAYKSGHVTNYLVNCFGVERESFYELDPSKFFGQQNRHWMAKGAANAKYFTSCDVKNGKPVFGFHRRTGESFAKVLITKNLQKLEKLRKKVVPGNRYFRPRQVPSELLRLHEEEFFRLNPKKSVYRPPRLFEELRIRQFSLVILDSSTRYLHHSLGGYLRSLRQANSNCFRLLSFDQKVFLYSDIQTIVSQLGLNRVDIKHQWTLAKNYRQFTKKMFNFNLISNDFDKRIGRNLKLIMKKFVKALECLSIDESDRQFFKNRNVYLSSKDISALYSKFVKNKVFYEKFLGEKYFHCKDIFFLINRLHLLYKMLQNQPKDRFAQKFAHFEQHFFKGPRRRFGRPNAVIVGNRD